VPAPARRAPSLNPLVELFDASRPAENLLPEQLVQLYGGSLSLPRSCLYANFVSSIDGVVALEGGRAPSGGIISRRSEADRFVMGLLRAFADAIVVGAGTVRAEGGRALWTPEFIFPAGAAGFQQLRRSLKGNRTPQLVIVTASGGLDPCQAALEAGALVLTTRSAELALRARLPSASRVLAISDGSRLEPTDVMAALRAEGYRVILTEGGPKLFGQFVEAGLVDELFLTLSPALAGHSEGQSFGLIEGVYFGRELRPAQLYSIRRGGDYLFLRYRLKEAA
jgi:riboflavin biosynthesis pyrimidine reductase